MVVDLTGLPDALLALAAFVNLLLVAMVCPEDCNWLD